MRRHAAFLFTAGCLVPALLVTPAQATSSASAVRAGTPVAAPAPVSAPAGAAAPSAVSAAVANARIKRVLRTRHRSRVLGSRYTMSVWDPESGQFVFKRRTKRSMRGASTMKILTSVGALATLGADHRFPTTVRSGATADEVVLVGGGDPLLTSADLRELARSTAVALGRIEPAPSASPTPGADPVDPSSPPATLIVRADDTLFRGTTLPKGWRSSYLPTEVRPVGAFARDDRRVWDATADAGAYFAGALRGLGVAASYEGEASPPPGAPTIATFAGHSVGEAVSHALLVSDNDTAEMLFRHVAVARGLPGTWKGARAALTATLAELGVPLARVRILDGSGLSLRDRVTARALSAALALALDPAHPELAGIPGWLPVAGRTGTLKAAYGRFSSWPSRCAAGLVQGKTGTLADAISLAGYAQGADARTKVYVAIVNRRPTRYTRLMTRQAVDRTVSSITGCW